MDRVVFETGPEQSEQRMRSFRNGRGIRVVSGEVAYRRQLHWVVKISAVQDRVIAC